MLYVVKVKVAGMWRRMFSSRDEAECREFIQSECYCMEYMLCRINGSLTTVIG